ncbi:hypothetical protein ACERII_07360 [Evansella sp. AB-rgal1]|uniref:hypothetical protein n=1 Tax=Evansella sp. AB-rgal1 TaxID=3242696 RepID=UPI00359D514E
MNKSYVSLGLIGIIVITISFLFKEPSEKVDRKNEDVEGRIQEMRVLEKEISNLKEYILELESELNTLNLENLNLKYRDAQSIEEELLLQDIFNISKRIIDISLLSEYLHDDTNVIFSQTLEHEYVIFFEDKSENSPTLYNLLVFTRGDRYGIQFHLTELTPPSGMNVAFGYDLNEFAGTVTNNDIETVTVTQGELKQSARIVKVKDNLRLWIAIFNKEEDSVSLSMDSIKVEGFNAEGDLIWKEGHFDGGWHSGLVVD